jgi:hypothetical protein
VPVVVLLLGSVNREVQTAAAKTLLSIAKKQEGLSLVLDAGGVSLLLQQLVNDNVDSSSSSSCCCCCCCTVLPSVLAAAEGINILAASAEGAHIFLSTSGSLASLLQALQPSCRPELEQLLCTAVDKMAASDNFAAAAMMPGCVPALIQLLGAGNDTVQGTAASALCSIAKTSAGLAHVAAGGVSPLLQQLASATDAERRQAAARGICRLAETSADGVQIIIDTPGSLAALLQAVESSYGSDIDSSICAAVDKMAGSDTLAAAAMMPGCVPALIQLLGAGNDTVQGTAASALCSIAKTSAGLAHVAAGGVSPLLQQLASATDAERRQAAARGICRLAETSADGVQIIIDTPGSLASLFQA